MTVWDDLLDPDDDPVILVTITSRDGEEATVWEGALSNLLYGAYISDVAAEELRERLSRGRRQMRAKIRVRRESDPQ